LEIGDIVLEVSGGGPTQPVGRTVLVDEQAIRSSDLPLICSNFCRRLVMSGNVDPRFVRYQLHHFYVLGNTDQYQRASTNIRNLQVPRYLEGTTIAIPPLAEQHRIVAVIEEQFSRLDAGIAALESATAKAGALTRAVMEAAVNGWDRVPLRELVHSLRNGIFVSRPGSIPTERAILRISAVRRLHLDATDVRYIPEAVGLPNEAAVRIEAGDLLFTRYNGNAQFVGACAMVQSDAAGLFYPDKLIRAVVNRARAMPEYLEIAVNCGPSLQAIALRRKTTAGQVGIAGGQLLDVPVPLPSLRDQELIVARTRQILDASHMLRSDIALASRRSDRLKSVLLAAAFSGRLVLQDPRDESASALIRRIEVERAATSGLTAENTRKPRIIQRKVSA